MFIFRDQWKSFAKLAKMRNGHKVLLDVKPGNGKSSGVRNLCVGVKVESEFSSPPEHDDLKVFTRNAQQRVLSADSLNHTKLARMKMSRMTVCVWVT